MKLNLYIILVLVFFTNCKKDNDWREVIIKWDKPLIYNDEDDGNINNSDCIHSGKTIQKAKGSKLHITLYNCSSPKTDSHVTITIKGNRPKNDNIIYESTNIYHQINMTIP